MNRQEVKVLVTALALILLGGAAIKFGKLKLGKPGLALVSQPLTNEFGAVVRDQRVDLPSKVEGYRSRDEAIRTFELEILPKDTTFGRKIYRNEEGFEAQLSAILMKSDRTSIHRPQICVTAQGWKIEKSERISIPIATPRAYNLSATCLTLGKEVESPVDHKKHPMKALYIYWFVSENRLAAQHPEALWYITRDLALTGTLYPWGYVSCFTWCAPGSEELSVARMKRLISAATPQFQLTTGAAKETAFLRAPDPVKKVNRTEPAPL